MTLFPSRGMRGGSDLPWMVTSNFFQLLLKTFSDCTCLVSFALEAQTTLVMTLLERLRKSLMRLSILSWHRRRSNSRSSSPLASLSHASRIKFVKASAIMSLTALSNVFALYFSTSDALPRCMFIPGLNGWTWKPFPFFCGWFLTHLGRHA